MQRLHGRSCGLRANTGRVGFREEGWVVGKGWSREAGAETGEGRSRGRKQKGQGREDLAQAPTC
jgi:hypothetical protein